MVVGNRSREGEKGEEEGQQAVEMEWVHYHGLANGWMIAAKRRTLMQGARLHELLSRSTPSATNLTRGSHCLCYRTCARARA